MFKALVLGAALLQQPGGTAQTVTVLDRHLRQTTGDLVALTKDGVKVHAGDKDVTVANPVAVVSTEAWNPRREWPGLPKDDGVGVSGVTVRLTDGSVLRGDLLTGKDDGLVLVNRRLGKVEFSLDGLETLMVQGEGGTGTPQPVGAKNGDAVRLVNGDRLEGFVESIAPPKESSGGTSLAVTIEHDKTRTAVPLDRVAWVVLHGSTKGAAQKMVWLEGGERTAAAELTFDGSEARIVRPAGALAAMVKADHLVGALLVPGAVVPLANCTVRSGGVAETGNEQVLGTRDLTLPEPEQAAFELPKGARRISGWAVLPEECRPLGDCTVRIAVAGASPGRERTLVEFSLNGASPVVKIDQELPADLGAGACLSITLGEGKNGPVQDRVVLRRVLVGLGE